MMVGIATAAVIWYPTRTAQIALPRFKNIIKLRLVTVTVCVYVSARARVCVRMRAYKILGHEFNFFLSYF